MLSIVFLVLGMVSILVTQVDVVYYRYLLSRSDFSEAIRIESIFNSTGRIILRYIFAIVGLGLLFLSGYCCLMEIPEHLPLVLSLIFGFMLWTMLLRVSFKIFLTAGCHVNAMSVTLAFSLPLVLIGIMMILAYLLPELPPIGDPIDTINGLLYK